MAERRARAPTRVWQLADEPGPVRPSAAARVPSVSAPGVHGDAHAEVLVGGEDLEAGAAEAGGERRGHVLAESKMMHDMRIDDGGGDGEDEEDRLASHHKVFIAAIAGSRHPSYAFVTWAVALIFGQRHIALLLAVQCNKGV